MAVSANANSGRALALERRRAMSSGGKTALGARSGNQTSAPAAATAPAPVSAPAASSYRPTPPSPGGGARKASLARRRAMSSKGKQAVSSRDRVRGPDNRAASRQSSAAAVADANATSTKDCGCGCGGNKEDKSSRKASERTVRESSSRTRMRRNKRPVIGQSPAKAAALARRRAQSSRGKAGISSSGMSEAQTARATNPQLSGRELAKALREQRSRRGSVGKKKSAPTGRRRKARAQDQGEAQDAPWKVGVSETSRGQSVTGTMVSRKSAMTGDEPSTCRDVTGTEYMGADVFRELCQAEPAKTPMRAGRTSTGRGNSVTGNEVGRSERVTGDEPGTCKRVTGSEYFSAEQSEAFCGSRAEPTANRVSPASETRKGKEVTGGNVGRASNVTGGEAGANRELTGAQYTSPAEGGAPPKVGHSKTLRGGSVSGTLLGRRERMTGDEAGSCRNVTGDDYVSDEQFSQFCSSKPAPSDQKVGATQTAGGEEVTGSMTGRSSKVTGNEPGTCKAVTGTPYAGSEQLVAHCAAPEVSVAQARTEPMSRKYGKQISGKQPAVGGAMTGDGKGACEPVSGTPYVGADQVTDVCAATAAEPGSADFPQSLGEVPWGGFSVEAPSHAAQQPAQQGHVTGGMPDGQGQITGPFGMAGGKVTGTEEARFGRDEVQVQPSSETAQEIDGRVKSRVTGEGQDAGTKITGDDWERGERVTGTEGASARQRNVTRRGTPAMANSMASRAVQPVAAPEPVNKVTGSSGSSDNGSLITYSGGARG